MNRLAARLAAWLLPMVWATAALALMTAKGFDAVWVALATFGTMNCVAYVAEQNNSRTVALEARIDALEGKDSHE